MRLSDVVKTVSPKTCYGMEAVSCSHIAGNINTEHSDTVNGGMFSMDPEIGSIHYRAQDVQPGGVFVAIKGLVADGHDFIDEAIKRGASAVVVQKPVKSESIIIEVENTRKALAVLSARFFNHPSEKLFLIGITGTNGKTTTAFLIERIFNQAGFKAGVIGTLNYRYAGKTFQNPMTTPESFDLQKILAEMLDNGVTHVVMEVSSHALDLFRVHYCRFDLAIFTNLTQDHLDYHHTMDAYWACKKRLFTEISNFKSMDNRILFVINDNDDKGKELIRTLKTRFGRKHMLTAGFSDNNDISSNRFSHDLRGITGEIKTPSGAFEFVSPLVGPHNLENILCATGAGLALGLSENVIKDAIESVQAVPGRLESVLNNRGRFVYVDYAHTPDALEKVLSSLRPSTQGRLICVFGCGGDRDKGKRSKMGEIAGRLSDLVVITSDNPRTESPTDIIDQITEGIKESMNSHFTPSNIDQDFLKGYVVEPDRRKAIFLAVKVSKENDAILIAGKGNEPYQIIGNETIVFDDRIEAGNALSVLENRSPGCKTQPGSQIPSGNPKPADQNLMPWRTAEILEASGGKLFCGSLDPTFAGVSIDSRKIAADELFIAVQGDVHDGHSFIGDVIEKGIGGLIVDQKKTNLIPASKLQDKGIVCITVDDTRRALGDLAAFHRRRSQASIVAVTGSNGKTSTRNMISIVVSRRFCTLSTQGNLNNDIGLPLTLLNLKRAHRWAVVELGMNRPGEILRLGEICLPDIGLITNIGPAHLEGLGSMDAIMKAKSELLKTIKPDGTAVLNADDPRLMKLADAALINVFLFGTSKAAKIRAESVRQHNEGLTFGLVLPGETISVRLQSPAKFMVSNALAAAAVACVAGLTADEIKEGLENFKPVSRRMNIHKTDKGIHIIDDTYNANPGSMQAAIETLTGLRGKNRGFLVAGDMLELGKHSASLHRMIGSVAAGANIAGLYVTGNFADDVAAGALEGQMDAKDIFKGSREEILKAITKKLDTGDWVLVKGSRGMTMETVVEGLLKWAGSR